MRPPLQVCSVDQQPMLLPMIHRGLDSAEERSIILPSLQTCKENRMSYYETSQYILFNNQKDVYRGKIIINNIPALLMSFDIRG